MKENRATQSERKKKQQTTRDQYCENGSTRNLTTTESKPKKYRTVQLGKMQ